MPLSPEQIVAEEFRLRARGYDRDEVDAFLDRLADQVEADTARLRNAEQRASALEDELAAVREREATLTRTLATVQDAADRARADAEEEVAALRTATERELSETRAQAQQEAAGIRSAAEHEAAELRARLREVQELDAAHRDRLRGHLEGQLDALEALPDPYAELLERAAGSDSGPVKPADAQPADAQPADPQPVDALPADPQLADPGDNEPGATPGSPPTPAVPAPEQPAGHEPAEEPVDGDGDEPHEDPWRRRDEPDADEPSSDRPVEPDPPIWG